MNKFCAAMGLCNLRLIKEEIAKRKRVTERYIHNLKDIKGIRLNAAQEGEEKNYANFPIVIDKKILGMTRNEVFAALEDVDWICEVIQKMHV